MFRKISTSIPAQLSNFEEKGQLTKAVLRVFHLGSTSDGRVFTKAFAEKLKANIGGTPVVARYDSESEDFEGHAATQSVFGFVPESPEVKFEKDEDGNTWLVTSVRLFTKREDVGSIARLIPGKAQSLELDPKSVKYNIISDENGDFQSFEFTDGDLIGLSVLGTQQAPAFSGSSFFTSLLSEDEKLERVINKYLSIEKYIEIDRGGESVMKNEFETEEARKKRLEEEAVAGVTVEDVLVPDPEPEDPDTDPEVPPVDPPVDPPEEPGDGEDGKDGEEGGEETTDPEGTPENPIPGQGEEGEGEGEVDAPEGDGDGADSGEGGDAGAGESFNEEGDVSNESSDEDFEEVEAKGEQATSNSASLTSEEREELESYRLKHKEEVISSYSDFLPEEVLKEFKEKASDYTIVELESKLALKSMAAMRETKAKPESQTQNQFSTLIPFAGINKNKTGKEDGLTELISSYIEVNK